MISDQSYKITEELLDNDLKREIAEGFAEHATSLTASDGNMKEITFIARDSECFLGAVHGKTFWGALHIKYLFVLSEARGRGIGKSLMEQAFRRGIEMGCRFAFVETMSFQAIDFYKSLGFTEEFVRSGYDKGTSFHYLKMNFNNKM